MPGTTIPFVPSRVRPSATKEDLDWVDLPIVDISKANTPEGRAELAPIVRDAMRTHGFLTIVNHGLTQAQNERIFDIADVPFSQVSEDEQKQFAGIAAGTGVYEGYKPRQTWTIDNGVRDQVDYYNFYGQTRHPKALVPLLPEILSFARHNHFNVLHPVMQLLALGLELPEDAFTKIHPFDENAAKYTRFLKYHPRSEQDEALSKNVWLKGHTDIGTITILWSQPISALQIMSSDGQWRWVKHIENALVVNIGDSMEMLSGGFYKATIHRVVQPPIDQRGSTRLGVFYFAMCDDNVKLAPLAESPVLQQQGISRKVDDANAPTMAEWRVARTKAYGFSELKRRNNNVEEEVISGVTVEHYN